MAENTREEMMHPQSRVQAGRVAVLQRNLGVYFNKALGENLLIFHSWGLKWRKYLVFGKLGGAGNVNKVAAFCGT